MKYVSRIILILFVTICVLPAGCQAAQIKSTADSKNDATIGMDQEKLHKAVMGFTDNFMANINRAADSLEDELQSPEVHLRTSRIRVYTFSSAIDIATSPSPGAAVLDMVVLVTLSRMVWEDFWQAKVFGKPADVMVKAFKKAEKDIWSIAATVLTYSQQNELRELILEWYQKNPEQTGVNYVRFSDFGNLENKISLSKVKQPGGLLAPVKEAVQAADEIRVTAERTKYMLSRMQLIVNYQVELMFRELMLEPESKQVLANLTKFRESMGHLAELSERLPDQIVDTSEKVIKQFMNNVSKERNETIHQASKELGKERKSALIDFAKIIEQERSILLAEIEEREADINKDIDRIVSELNALAEHRIDHIFNRLIQILVISSFCLLIIVVVHHLLSKRLSSQKKGA